MSALIGRNLKLFFRDKASVFYSLLSVFIIIGLYVLFLGDTIQSGMTGVEGARFLMDSWIMAGVLGVSSLTTTLGAFGIMVDDRAKKLLKDFSASPLRRSMLAGGYILSAVLTGLILSLVALILGEAYIVAYGGALLSLPALAKVLGCMILSVISSSAMVFLLVSFLHSLNAFGTASTVVGTLVGFVTGVYMPIHILPGAVQMVIKLFPVSHAAVLFRQIMMEQAMADAFKGAPAAAALQFRRELGVEFTYGGTVFPWWGSVLVLVATAAIFYSLALINLSRKSK